MPLSIFRRPRRSADPVPLIRRRSGWTGRSARALAILGAASLVAGCTGWPLRPSSDRPGEGGFFGWHIQAPFDTSEVKTVFVYFKSQTFRRDLQLQLMEAVTKEINLRTPYRVVQDPNKADSILTGRIAVADKNLVVEAPTNLPRQLNATMNVWVNWTHNPPTEEEKGRPDALISETINFVPEVGETSMTAFYEVVQSIAKQIVDMMEQAWFTTDEDLR